MEWLELKLVFWKWKIQIDWNEIMRGLVTILQILKNKALRGLKDSI
jgi:hypothetical protein